MSIREPNLKWIKQENLTHNTNVYLEIPMYFGQLTSKTCFAGEHIRKGKHEL